MSNYLVVHFGMGDVPAMLWAKKGFPMLFLQNLPNNTHVVACEDLKFAGSDSFVPKGTLGNISESRHPAWNTTVYSVHWPEVQPKGIAVSRSCRMSHVHTDRRVSVVPVALQM